MTKYVLASGSTSKYPEKAKKFFTEIVNGLGSNPKILICSFAIPRENWEARYEKYVQEIPTYMPEGVTTHLELAYPDTFVEQVQACDVLYMSGGDDYLIQYWLKQFDLPKLWKGKVIVTGSASSNALVKYFWTCDWRQNMAGLGILPIKFLPHFKSDYGSADPRGPIDWDKAYTDLENYEDTTLPIYALEEGEYKVITV